MTSPGTVCLTDVCCVACRPSRSARSCSTGATCGSRARTLVAGRSARGASACVDAKTKANRSHNGRVLTLLVDVRQACDARGSEDRGRRCPSEPCARLYGPARVGQQLAERDGCSRGTVPPNSFVISLTLSDSSSTVSAGRNQTCCSSGRLRQVPTLSDVIRHTLLRRVLLCVSETTSTARS